MDRPDTEQTPFKSKPSKSETKADTTTRTAKAIIDDELARREAKTARLRQARIENEIKLAAEPPVKPAPKRAASRAKATT
jgi:hypothetical protein